MTLTKQERMRISAESLCDLRTVARVYDGERRNWATELRIQRAAEKLGLPCPPLLHAGKVAPP